MLTKENLKGQGIIEYALIILLVTMAVIIVLTLLGPAVGDAYSRIIASI